MLSDSRDNTLVFHFTPTFREVMGASFFMAYKSWVVYLASLFTGAMALLLGGIGLSSKLHSIYPMWQGMAFMFFLVPIIILLNTIYESNQLTKIAIEMQIDTNNLKIKHGTVASEIGWDNILKIGKIDRVLGFYFAKNQAHFLPLRVVSDEQLQAILTLFQQSKTK